MYTLILAIALSQTASVPVIKPENCARYAKSEVKKQDCESVNSSNVIFKDVPDDGKAIFVELQTSKATAHCKNEEKYNASSEKWCSATCTKLNKKNAAKIADCLEVCIENADTRRTWLCESK
jgi:ribosomal protein L22